MRTRATRVRRRERRRAVSGGGGCRQPARRRQPAPRAQPARRRPPARRHASLGHAIQRTRGIESGVRASSAGGVRSQLQREESSAPASVPSAFTWAAASMRRYAAQASAAQASAQPLPRVPRPSAGASGWRALRRRSACHGFRISAALSSRCLRSRGCCLQAGSSKAVSIRNLISILLRVSSQRRRTNRT